MYTPTILHRKIRSHSVFIIDRKRNQIGFGVLVQLEDRFFVFSAEHVVSGDIEISLGLDVPNTPFTILHKWVDNERDVAFLELEPREVTFLRSEYNEPYVVHAISHAAVPVRNPRLAICGFPYAIREDKGTHIEYPVMFQKVAILEPDQWPEVYRGKFDPSANIVVIYGPKRGGTIVWLDHETTKPLDPSGFSGSGLWHCQSEDENAVNPIYSLVAILRSHDEFYQILLCTSAQFIVDAICKQYDITLSKPDSNSDVV